MIWDMTLDTLFWLSTSACSTIPLDLMLMAHELTAKQLGGAAPKKVIVVPGKIVNIVM